MQRSLLKAGRRAFCALLLLACGQSGDPMHRPRWLCFKALHAAAVDACAAVVRRAVWVMKVAAPLCACLAVALATSLSPPVHAEDASPHWRPQSSTCTAR